jgi:hypothetical protein
VKSVLFAEAAILVHFKPVRVILLVFHCVVVALFTFSASKCYFYSHNGTSRFTEIFFAFTLCKSKRLPRFKPLFMPFWKPKRKAPHKYKIRTNQILLQKKRTFQR